MYSVKLAMRCDKNMDVLDLVERVIVEKDQKITIYPEEIALFLNGPD